MNIHCLMDGCLTRYVKLIRLRIQISADSSDGALAGVRADEVIHCRCETALDLLVIRNANARRSARREIAGPDVSSRSGRS